MSKSYYLSEENFGILSGLKDWEVRDIPPEHWNRMPHLHRPQDLIGVFASGCSVTPKTLNDNLANVGIDFIAHEPNPNKERGEDEVNVYHFTISKMKNPAGDLRYKLDGPYYREALLEHWPCAEDALAFYSSVGLPLPPSTSGCSDTTESE